MAILTYGLVLLLAVPFAMFALRFAKRHPDRSAVLIAFWAGAALPLLGFVLSLAASAVLWASAAGRDQGNGILFALLLLAALSCAVVAVAGFLGSWVAVLWSRRT